MSKFRILCEVSGGVTGNREGYFKSNGKVEIFDNEEKANVYRDQLAKNAAACDKFKPNVHDTNVSYSYTVESYDDDKPRNFSTEESLEVVWAALQGYREDCIPTRTVVDRRPGAERGTSMEVDDYEKEWSNVCLAMAWITEAIENAPQGPLTGDELLATHTYKGQSALDLD